MYEKTSFRILNIGILIDFWCWVASAVQIACYSCLCCSGIKWCSLTSIFSKNCMQHIIQVKEWDAPNGQENEKKREKERKNWTHNNKNIAVHCNVFIFNHHEISIYNLPFSTFLLVWLSFCHICVFIPSSPSPSSFCTRTHFFITLTLYLPCLPSLVGPCLCVCARAEYVNKLRDIFFQGSQKFCRQK